MSASGIFAPASTASNAEPPLDSTSQAAWLAATPKSQVETTTAFPFVAALAEGDAEASKVAAALAARNSRRFGIEFSSDGAGGVGQPGGGGGIDQGSQAVPDTSVIAVQPLGLVLGQQAALDQIEVDRRQGQHLEAAHRALGGLLLVLHHDQV